MEREMIIEVFLYDGACQTYKAVINSNNIITTSTGTFCSLSGFEVPKINPRELGGLVIKKGLLHNIRGDRWVLIGSAQEIYNIFHKEEIEIMSKYCGYELF